MTDGGRMTADRSPTETARTDAFDEAHALGQARAFLTIADAALRNAHTELAALGGGGPCGVALPRRHCEDASDLLARVRRILHQAIGERR